MNSKLFKAAFLAAAFTTTAAHAFVFEHTSYGETYKYKINTIQGSYLDLFNQLNSQPWISSIPITGGAYSTQKETNQMDFAGALGESPGSLSLNSFGGINYRPLVYVLAYPRLDPNDGIGTRTIVGVNDNGTSYVYINDNDTIRGSSITGFSLSGNYYWFVASLAPDSRDTYFSMEPNAYELRKAFNLKSAKIAQGLSYDCTVYDQKNICVSFVGSKSDGKNFDATTGALILAHKPTQNFRFGGYIDQSFGSSTSGGLTIRKGSPDYGVFGVWSQNADGSGVEVRASANTGKLDIETTRTAVDSAEAGFGKSDIKSSGFQLEVSRGYAINSQWSARPYLGYRKTTNTRAGYTETDSVEAPLTYSSLKQNTETLTVGATFAHALSDKTKMFLTAGVEHDLKNRIGNYQAANEDIGGIDSIDMGLNKSKTRPTVSFALNHDIDKTQRVGLSLTHRKEAFASGSTTSAFLQYSKGF